MIIVSKSVTFLCFFRQNTIFIVKIKQLAQLIALQENCRKLSFLLSYYYNIFFVKKYLFLQTAYLTYPIIISMQGKMAYLMSVRNSIAQSKLFTIKSIEAKTGILLQPLGLAVYGLSFWQKELFNQPVFLQSTFIKLAFFVSTAGLFLISIYEFSPLKYSVLFVKSFIRIFSVWIGVLVFNLIFLMFRNGAEAIIKFDFTLNQTLSFLWLFLVYYLILVVYKGK